MSKIKEIDTEIFKSIEELARNKKDLISFDDMKELISKANKEFNCNIEVRDMVAYDHIKKKERYVSYAWAGLVDGELYFNNMCERK